MYNCTCMKVGIPLKLSEPAWYSATSDYDRASYRREMQMLHHHYFSLDDPFTFYGCEC